MSKNTRHYFQHACFLIRFRYFGRLTGSLRKFFYGTMGMVIGKTSLPKLHVTWPHQVTIGDFCRIEHDVYFHYDGIWKPGPSILIGNRVFIGNNCEFNITRKISIGNNCLIASGCKFIDHDHGMALDYLIREQRTTEFDIAIGENVWLGCNVIVLKGVIIENGAVVAAGAVVTKNIAENEIWGGVPAKKIGHRG